MKRVWLPIVALVAAGAGAALWWYVARDDCRQLARTLCAESPAHCRDLEIAFARGGNSAGWCRETNESLQSMARVPAGKAAPNDVRILLRALDLDLQQGRSPVPRMDKLRAAGPAACVELLRSFGRADESAQKKRIVHQLLIDLRGQDLGPDAAAWWRWCEDAFKQSGSGPSP
jgi:hypothetical protein